MSERFHGLDALRSFMMLLGLWLHVSLAYMSIPIPQIWPFRDPAGFWFFDLQVVFIHAFRMPVFFFLAGFFAAFQVERRGAVGMIKNRLLRIALPLIVFTALLNPPVAFAWKESFAAMGWPWPESSPFGFNPLHLWFLYYLALFYLVTWLWKAAGGPGGRLGSKIGRWFAFRWHGMAVLVLGTAAVVVLMPGGTLETPGGWLPNTRVVAAYLLFYGVGYHVWGARHALAKWSAAWPWLLSLALPLGLALWISQGLFYVPDKEAEYYVTVQVVAALLTSMLAWLCVAGFTGMVMRLLAKERPWVRYLSDGSYWIYLVHLPLAILIPLWIKDWPLGPLLKSLFAVAACASLCLLSYAWLVRRTWIGVFLNGRRLP